MRNRVWVLAVFAWILCFFMPERGSLCLCADNSGTEELIIEEEMPELIEIREEAVPDIEPDFLGLYRENADTVGWILAGDDINYPVVQYDNDYYLHHNFYQQEDENGTIFVNAYNRLNPRDWIVMLHGHHMNSGNMFGNLMYFEDYDYVRRHPLVIFRTIYDPADVYYVPVAAFNVSMETEDPAFFYVAYPGTFYEEELAALRKEKWERSKKQEEEVLTEKGEEVSEEPDTEDLTEYETEMPLNPDAEETEEYETEVLTALDLEELPERIEQRKEAYLREILDRSLWKAPVDVTTGDELLMLATCSYYHEDGRFLLFCRKLREEETPELIQNIFG